MYHSFLIHLTADGHLGCFHVLAIINSAAMNINLFLKIYFSLEDNCFTMCWFLLYISVNQVCVCVSVCVCVQSYPTL